MQVRLIFEQWSVQFILLSIGITNGPKLAAEIIIYYNYLLHETESSYNRFAASQEIPRISRNPKVHYRTHKRPPHVSILSQPNPVHIPTSHLLQNRPNIIHPSTPTSPQWSSSLRFPHQDPIQTLSLIKYKVVSDCIIYIFYIIL